MKLVSSSLPCAANRIKINHEDKDHFIQRNGVRYAGTHLILDLWGAKNLDNIDHIEKTLHEAVIKAGATLLHTHLHHFTPNGGVSGVVVLAESHISIHTWPENGYAALDVFMCGDASPHETIQVLKKAFSPERILINEQMRGGTFRVEILMKGKDMTSWYNETLHSQWGQRFSVDRILFEKKTEYFDLIIFENSQFGRVMALDGAIQTTEADEFVYHEMLTHVPLFAYGNAKNILIVGGGDGGILREVCKHPVDSITMVEIDPTVIELSQEFFPNHSNGSFNDSRLKLIIQDAALFVSENKDSYDIIIVDSTDPYGPGAVLFSEEFYKNCFKRLVPGGLLVNQNGVPFLQPDELTTTYKRLSGIFKDVSFYTAAVPTYAGGLMTLGWASNNSDLRNVPLETLEQRFASSQLKTNYYTPACHQASFALPAFMLALLLKK